jgi:hypothetical protein
MPIKKKVSVKSKPVYKKATTSKIPQSVKSYVDKTLNKRLETKIAYISTPNTPFPAYAYVNNTANFVNNNTFITTPNAGKLVISQGVGQADRIGNRITTRKATFNLVLYPKEYDATYNYDAAPQLVRIVVFKLKGGYSLSSFLSSDFFQTGNTATGLSSRLTDMNDHINRDLATVYKDFIVKLGRAIQPAATGSSSNQYYANNDYKMNHLLKIDVTSSVPKRIEFDDTGATASTNESYIVWMPVAAIGAPMANGAYPMYCNYSYTYEYEDA